MQTINLNNRVKVRLTDRGRKHLKNKIGEKAGGYQLEEDLEGCSIWHLWVLMGAFGELLQAPTLSPPFEPEIIILDD